MPNKLIRVVIFLCLVTTAFAQWKKAPLEPPSVINPNLYRADANASAEIQHAIAAAQKQHKRVLLVFGANWCIDCHILDRAFHQPRIAPLLESNFLVVHIDVGQYERNLQLAKKYHAHLEKGVPEVSVLESNGTFLYSSTEFEKSRLLTEEDVVAFLDKWKPRRTSAQSVSR
ncbi:MAG TPA: thioredoxin family protein [Candidatus Angelobacter sp.]|jgi:thiol:disulfide interchange protein|nr:thioredoxin family protein [Candidatus Angelobacter sp.]